jgi:hypothetical protein
MEQIARRNQEKAAKRYAKLAGTGLAAEDMDRIVPAALDGRVEILFVDSHVQIWGAFHADGRTLEVHDSRQAGDEELLDFAATQTLLHRGTVYSVERERLPSDRPAAALLRY